MGQSRLVVGLKVQTFPAVTISTCGRNERVVRVRTRGRASAYFQVQVKAPVLNLTQGPVASDSTIIITLGLKEIYTGGY